jgi:predicted alpha/beta superfamily hydrolase
MWSSADMLRRFLPLLAGSAVATAALGGTGNATAQDARASAGKPIPFGISHDIASTALSEHRIVNVVLPASYGQDLKRRYPVLYLIDGGVEQDLIHVAGVARLGAIWGRSAEAIVVGVETKDRRKELTGPTKDPELLRRFPTAGSSAKFREFIRAEVKPLIERSYRTNERDVVMGESLAGLFVVETYLLEPSLFGAYGAVDPSLWWDGEALSISAAAKVGAGQRSRSLFLAVAKEQMEEASAYKRLVSSLRSAKIEPCLVPRPEQTHATIYQQLTPTVLQYLLPPTEPAPPEFGFTVSCSADL